MKVVCGIALSFAAGLAGTAAIRFDPPLAFVSPEWWEQGAAFVLVASLAFAVRTLWLENRKARADNQRLRNELVEFQRERAERAERRLGENLDDRSTD